MKTDLRVWVVVRHDPNSSDEHEVMSVHGDLELAQKHIAECIEEELAEADIEDPGWCDRYKKEWSVQLKKYPGMMHSDLDLDKPADLLYASSDVDYEILSDIPLYLRKVG